MPDKILLKTIKVIISNYFIYNNKFNLLSNLVPLMGPHRLIPIVKT